MRCRPAISSMSLGRAWVHGLPAKLDCAAAAGIEGIEVFYQDIEYAAKALPGGDTAENRELAARAIRDLCDARNLTIISLQPFMHSEGLIDRNARAERLQELSHWFNLATILRTDIIQMPASFLPPSQLTSDISKIVADMREAADMAAAHAPPLRIAMEALCFSTHIYTWEQSWSVVQQVDRPNIGLCLDTFNIAGRIYGDPTTTSGVMQDAGTVSAASIARLSSIDPKKIFFIQVVDAQRLDKPLLEDHPLHDPEMAPRMSWSRNCRLFYGEKDRGAYLPIKAITRAILDTGYDGWISMEYFNADMQEPGADVPKRLATRAIDSWKRLVEDMA